MNTSFPFRVMVLLSMAFASLSPAFGKPAKDKNEEKLSLFADVAPADVVSRVREANPAGSIVAEHGRLSVSGSKLVDEKGNPIQLRGMGAFWINWGEGKKYVNKDVISHLVSDWGIQVYRVAVGVEPSGAYSTNPAEMIALATAAIDACIENGIYVLVDWHVHDAPPYGEKEAAFFKGIANAYGKYPNVIYELWNEPVHVNWKKDIKPFAEDLIRNVIRPIDPDNIIVVGTPTWSQDVDAAARSPIDAANLMYTLHFYAGTHGQELRSKANAAIKKGLALFITEWGTSLSDGGSDRKNYFKQSDTWLKWVDKNGLSWANWSISDKAEGSAALKPGTSASGAWTDEDLTPTGLYVRDRIREGR